MSDQRFGRPCKILCLVFLVGLYFQFDSLKMVLINGNNFRFTKPDAIATRDAPIAMTNVTHVDVRIANHSSQGHVHSSPSKHRTRLEALPLPPQGACPETPPFLVGNVKIDRSNTTIVDEELRMPRFTSVQSGGVGRPDNCIPRHRVALLVPYRDRAPQLAQFLRHIHPILIRQQLDYRVFLVEQTAGGVFNKGVLFNAGVLEMERRFPGYYTCIVLQDGDILPESDNILYTCTQRPKHMATYLDSFGYKQIGKVTVGGIFLLDVALYYEVNGLSNAFYGWGGEDDDFSYRLEKHNITYDLSPDWAHCSTLEHGGRHTEGYNYMLHILALKEKRLPIDGLNNVNYTLVEYREQPLFTNITVTVNIKEADVYLKSIDL